ncbi:MAG: response regulator transcription factor [Bacillales bacterium]|nr:response regulator transcription factor [Bacillales bacterium]
MSKILVVDDELDIALLIKDVLEDEGFSTTAIDSSKKALELVQKEKFDLILLDVMMPEMSGTTLCTKIREITSSPIIFVTAKTSTLDKLLGFEVGADDYITKPFIIEELVARVKAHIRRNNRVEVSNIIKIGEIEINLDSYEVYKNNSLIDLSTREFELLAYLMKNAGIVLSKEKIFNSVWGENYGEIGTVAVHIKSLRNKLDPDEKYIKTIWGLGYKFIKVLDEH